MFIVNIIQLEPNLKEKKHVQEKCQITVKLSLNKKWNDHAWATRSSC